MKWTHAHNEEVEKLQICLYQTLNIDHPNQRNWKERIKKKRHTYRETVETQEFRINEWNEKEKSMSHIHSRRTTFYIFYLFLYFTIQ